MAKRRAPLLGLLLWAVLPPYACAGSLSGRVLEDHTGRPVFLAGVRVLAAGGSLALKAPLTTDTSGRFQTPDLPAGTYNIEVYARDSLETRVLAQIPGPPLTIRLARLGAISGRVTDLQGQPNRGARVAVWLKPGQGMLLQELASSSPLDRNGRYRIAGLPPGEYAVAVANAPAEAGGLRPYYYPRNARPQFFTVTSGEEYRDIDFPLPRLAQHRISGTLAASSGGERAVVSLYLTGQPMLPLAAAWSSRDGAFALDEVPSGDYNLVATRPTYGYGAQSGVLTPEDVLAQMPLQVSADLEGLTLTPSPRLNLRLSLRAAAGTGQGQDCPPSAPVTLTQVLAPGASERRTLDVPFNGSVDLDGIPPGRYRVEADMKERCFLLPPSSVDVQPASAPAGLVLQAVRAGSIGGKVSAGPSGLEGLAVVLLAPPSPGAPARLQATFPDAVGRFRFDHLRPGRYRIAARPAGARWIPQPAEMIEIEALPGETAEVNLNASLPSYR